MGALSQHFEEVEAEHKKEVAGLQKHIIELEAELSIVKGRYDSLCGKVRQGANNKRNEADNFLRNYATGENNFWR
jgi:hypothetical protein